MQLAWDPVKGASSYELEIRLGDKEPKIHKVTKTEFQLKVPPGTYQVRMRSIDKDGPGYWGDPIEIPVYPVEVALLSPEEGKSLAPEDFKDGKVIFKWKPSANISSYELVVRKTSGKGKAERVNTEKTRATLKLEFGQTYEWSVRARGKGGIEYGKSDFSRSFSTVGESLKPPILLTKGFNQKGELKWESEEKAESHSLKVLRKSLLGEEWEPYLKEDIAEASVFKLKKDLPPGLYRVELISMSKTNLPSPPARHEFLVKPRIRDLANIKD